MKASRTGRQQSGLTLIEVLIALSLFALLSLGSFRMLNFTAGVVTRADGIAGSVQSERRAISLLSADIRHIVAHSSGTSAAGATKPAVQVIAGESLEFSRAGQQYGPGISSPALIRLRYRLVPSQESQAMHLVREFMPLNADDSSAIREQVLLSEVNELQLRMLDSLGRWHDQWPSQQEQAAAGTNYFDQAELQIPAAIEVQLTSNTRSIRRVFSMR